MASRLMGNNDVYMPITPMFHVHAWGLPYAATMLGLKQVYPGRYDPELLVELWRKEKVTFSHCVPTILQMVLNAKAAQGHRFRGWKIVIGGSALIVPCTRAPRQRGMHLTAAYGMSETGPIFLAHLNDEMMAGTEDEAHHQPLKAGVPVPLVERTDYRCRGQFPAARRPHSGRTGRCVRRWLTMAYFNEPEKGAELLGKAAGCTPVTWRPSARRRDRDPRPHQGRDQDRWRVDFLAGPGRPDQPSSGGARSGGGGHAGRALVNK